MPFVHNSLVQKNKGYGRSIKQFIDIFLKPYFKSKKRKFNINEIGVALVELFDDEREPIIKLDKDVLIKLEFKEKKIKPSDLGKEMKIDLKEIKSVTWDKKGLNKNSGKVLIIRFNKDWWILILDTRYNKGTAKKKLNRADEFLKICRTIYRKKEYCPHALIYLLWSAGELIFDTKAQLYSQKIKQTHDDRLERLKKLSLSSNIFSQDFTSTFFALSDLKSGARYANKNYKAVFKKANALEYMRVLESEASNITI